MTKLLAKVPRCLHGSLQSPCGWTAGGKLNLDSELDFKKNIKHHYTLFSS